MLEMARQWHPQVNITRGDSTSNTNNCSNTNYLICSELLLVYGAQCVLSMVRIVYIGRAEALTSRQSWLGSQWPFTAQSPTRPLATCHSRPTRCRHLMSVEFWHSDHVTCVPPALFHFHSLMHGAAPAPRNIITHSPGHRDPIRMVGSWTQLLLRLLLLLLICFCCCGCTLKLTLTKWQTERLTDWHWNWIVEISWAYVAYILYLYIHSEFYNVICT